MITIGLFSLLTHIAANNRDIDMKLSGYDLLGLPNTSQLSWITLGAWVSFLSIIKLYISSNNRDIDVKLKGYDPWGLSTASRTSWLTLGSWVSFGGLGMITSFFV